MKKTTKKHYILELRNKKLEIVRFNAYGKIELKKLIKELINSNLYFSGYKVYEYEDN